jgi:twitching motility protein PilT
VTPQAEGTRRRRSEKGHAVAHMNILIVHDDAEFVNGLSSALKQIEPTVQIVNALSGPRAQAMIAQVVPTVLVVDAQLLGVDGFAFTRMVKTEPATKDVPVIIVSLDANEAAALKARQVGASALMSSVGQPQLLASKIVALGGASATSDPSARTAEQPQRVSAGVMAPVGAAVGAASAAVGAPQAAATAYAAPASAAGPSSQPDAYGAPQPVTSPVSAPVAETCGAPEPVSSAVPAAFQIAEGGTPHLDDLLRLMLQRGGSDLHLTVGSPPGIRQRGDLLPIENMQPFSPRDTMEMIYGVLSEEQRKRYENELELDFAYSIPGVSRFRANVFQQRNSMGAVFRVIPIDIPTLADLGLPAVCTYLAERPRGLVLVTGPTGSGKSTTLAAMIDHINATRPLHIITLEDPIEFMHRNKMSYVNQREIGEDTHSFAGALRRVLRQDPDVILVGEMRDLETISAAITAAETGHLVLATLHTTGAPETIDRIIDVFPPHQQQQVRMQVSTSLQGVLSQTLLRSTDGRARVLAMEIMLGVPAIGNLIREGKTHQMETIIQGSGALGMQTLDQSLKTLLQAGKVTFEEAIAKAKNPRELAGMLGRKI